jgi:hypothetical protein
LEIKSSKKLLISGPKTEHKKYRWQSLLAGLEKVLALGCLLFACENFDATLRVEAGFAWSDGALCTPVQAQRPAQIF